MPTYAYRCNECGHAFDIYQQFSDAALSECPECGGALRKVFGSLGVTFNGSGFYRTDSRGSGSGAASSGGTDGAKTSTAAGSASASGASSSGASSSGTASSSAS